MSSSTALPEVLPVFPLTGAVLLPGNFLPLNVFEPRYRNLVRDAASGERWIGMVQPRTPMADGWGPVAGAEEAPELYEVGCAGRIRECDPQPDGRFVILLRGAARFRIREELAPRDGYRRVRADYAEFAVDRDGESCESRDAGGLLAAVGAFQQRHGFTLDLDLLAALPAATLINALSAALPFAPAEKQALLEATSCRERESVLLELLRMGIEPPEPGSRYRSPPVH